MNKEQEATKLYSKVFSGNEVLQRSFIGIFLAIAIAFMFLPFLSSMIYYVITGGAFPGLVF